MTAREIILLDMVHVEKNKITVSFQFLIVLRTFLQVSETSKLISKTYS